MIFVRMRTAQSTPACRPDQAARALVVVLFLFAPAAWSQTVGRDADIFTDVDGVRLGRVVAGTAVQAGPVRAGFTQITVEGWIFGQSLEPSRREGFQHQVAAEENLRDSPNGRIAARLVRGMALNEVERRGQWVRVRRSVWIQSSALGGTQGGQNARDAQKAQDAQNAQNAQSPPPDPRRAVVRRRLNLFRAPDSAAIGTLEAGHPVRITARAGGWVRVETQAWVRENEIRVSDAGILAGVTAAELRGAPEEFRGRLLRWTIQFLALQTADELRPDFVPGQRYILARGPAPEYAFVYIVVPPELVPSVERIEPLSSVSLVARVRNGRSAYLANPILELVELL